MSTGPKQAIFAEFAGVARALGHAHRLELLEHLAQGERASRRSPSGSGCRLPMPRSTCSSSGAPASSPTVARASSSSTASPTTAWSGSPRRCGRSPSATLPRSIASAAATSPNATGSSRSHDRSFWRGSRPGSSRCSTSVPRTSSPTGICRARSTSRYASSAAGWSELDPGREVIAYCRGAYCVFSFEAVASLRARGTSPPGGSKTASPAAEAASVCAWREINS